MDGQTDLDQILDFYPIKTETLEEVEIKEIDLDRVDTWEKNLGQKISRMHPRDREKTETKTSWSRKG